MIVRMFLINTFIDGLFTGGQALVAILRQRCQTHLLTTLARELKAPVTAYVLPCQDRYAVRYFAADGELKSGGYAALAVAKALYSVGLAPPDQPLRLEGLNGPALLRPAAALGLDRGVGLVLPPAPPSDWAEDPPAGLDRAAVLSLMTVGPYRLVCLAEPSHLPDHAAALSPRDGRLVLSWPRGGAGYDLRCYGAAGEEAEPPVDLDFHAALARFWGGRLGRTRLDIRHLARRPALLRAELTAEAVELAGRLQIIYKAAPALNEPADDSSLGDFLKGISSFTPPAPK